MPWRLKFSGTETGTQIRTPYLPKHLTSTTIEAYGLIQSVATAILLGEETSTNVWQIRADFVHSWTNRLFSSQATVLTYPLGQVFRAAMVWNGSGSPNRFEIDNTSASIARGTTDPAAFTIGGNGTGISRWVGIIFDVRIYDGDFGQLLHHWPIDDNAPDGGTIRDVVGGLDGTLTLANGEWVWVPESFGSVRPVVREAVRPVVRRVAVGQGV